MARISFVFVVPLVLLMSLTRFHFSTACHVANQRMFVVGTLLDKNRELIDSISECLIARMGGQFDWPVVTRFAIQDTKWYTESNSIYCSNDDTTNCWKTQMDFLVDPYSSTSGSIKECIKEYASTKTFNPHRYNQENIESRSGRRKKRSVNNSSLIFLLLAHQRLQQMQQNLLHRSNANHPSSPNLSNQIRTGNNNNDLQSHSMNQQLVYRANTTPYPSHIISTTKPAQNKNYWSVNNPSASGLYPVQSVTTKSSLSNLLIQPSGQSKPPASISSQYQAGSYRNYYRPVSGSQQNNYRHAQYPQSTQLSNQYYNRQPPSGTNQLFGTQTPWPSAIRTPTGTSGSSNQIRQTLTQLATLANSEHDRNIINLILKVLPVQQQELSTQSPILITFIKQLLSTINPGGTKKPSVPGSGSSSGSTAGTVRPVITANLCDRETIAKFIDCVKIALPAQSRSMRTPDIVSVLNFFQNNYSKCSPITRLDSFTGKQYRQCSTTSRRSGRTTCLPTVMLDIVRESSPVYKIIRSCAT